MMTFIICFFAFCIISGGVSLIWRLNMMVNHPEKYRQFRKFEKEYEDSMKKNLTQLAEVAKKAVGLGIGIAARLLKK